MKQILVMLVLLVSLITTTSVNAQGDLPPGYAHVGDDIEYILQDPIIGDPLFPPWVFPEPEPDGPLIPDFFDDFNDTTLFNPPLWNPPVIWDPNIWPQDETNTKLRDIFDRHLGPPPYYVVPPVWTTPIPEPSPYINSTLSVTEQASGTRIWSNYFQAWDKIDNLEVTLSGARPDSYYAFQVRFLDGYQAQLPGQPPVPNWGEWHTYVAEMDPANDETPFKIIAPNFLPTPSQRVPFHGNLWGGSKTNGSGSTTFTFGPLGLYDPTSVIPNMPDPVIWKQGTYSGHISTQYLIQIRYICFPISTGWAGWPTLTGPFYYPTGWQPYLVSEPQEFLIYVDAGDRPDPPGPPGGGGQG